MPPQSSRLQAGRIGGQPPVSSTMASGMRLPDPVDSIRNTAEWLASPSRFAAEEPARDTRTSVGLPASILPDNFGGTIGRAR